MGETIFVQFARDPFVQYHSRLFPVVLSFTSRHEYALSLARLRTSPLSVLFDPTVKYTRGRSDTSGFSQMVNVPDPSFFVSSFLQYPIYDPDGISVSGHTFRLSLHTPLAVSYFQLFSPSP